jgi:hypothetical protein
VAKKYTIDARNRRFSVSNNSELVEAAPMIAIMTGLPVKIYPGDGERSRNLIATQSADGFDAKLVIEVAGAASVIATNKGFDQWEWVSTPQTGKKEDTGRWIMGVIRPTKKNTSYCGKKKKLSVVIWY